MADIRCVWIHELTSQYSSYRDKQFQKSASELYRLGNRQLVGEVSAKICG
jgi:hypothetical protein